MTNDVVRNVRIKYSLTGATVITRKLERMSASQRKVITTTQQFNRANKHWMTMSRNVRTASTSMNKAKSSVTGLATRFVGLQAALHYGIQKIRELAKWVQKSIKDFREYEKSLAEVSTILTDLSKGDMPRFEQGIARMSMNFGKGVKDLSKGMYDILSAAFVAEEGMELLETASKAAVAGLTDVSTSVDVFTSILNAWGLEVSQAVRISNELFQTVVRGKLVYEDLASAMGYIAPIAANLGVEFKEIAAALSTVTRQGQHVDMATRGLALGLQNIADITPKAAAAARKYEVDLSAVALQVGGLEAIINDLNRATNEYGAKVLPEMITNMRSLRVFMALAGKEGVLGFRDDLRRLQDTTGRTDEALSKMMNTQQFQADIIAQSMKQVERSIGEAWSGIDLWWKKSKVWWGTLLSGGDADRAVRNIDERIQDIRLNSIKLLDVQIALVEAKPLSSIISAFDFPKISIGNMLGNVHEMTFAAMELSEAIASNLNVEAVKKFFTLRDEELEIGKYISKLDAALLLAESFKGEMELAGIIDDPSQEIHYDIQVGNIEKVGKSAKTYNKELTEILESMGLFDIAGTSVNNTLSNINDTISKQNVVLSNTQEEMELYSKSELELREILDDTSKSIGIHKGNIIELDNEIRNLKIGVEDLYRAFGGQEFAGKDVWTLAFTAANTQLERFTRYSKMAIKYGDEMNDEFMNGIEGLQGYSEAFSQIPEYLNEYNKEIWEIVNANDEYSGTIIDLVNELGAYTEAQEELRKEQEISKKVLDELSLAMRKNNLEISKIELKGMIRRRGLTRSEELMIKKIKIENAEIRIKITEREIAEEEELLKESSDEHDTYFEGLKDMYDEYIARVQFDLGELKDTRDDDLVDMMDNIKYKRGLLEKYTQWRTEQFQKLSDDMITYRAIVSAIDTVGLREKYYDFLGIDLWEEANRLMREHIALIGGETGGGATGTFVGAKDTVSNFVDVVNRGGFGAGIDYVMDELRRGGGFQRGIGYVPETRPYVLHQGEQVLPAGSEGGAGGTVIIDIVNYNTITSNVDAESFAELQAEAINLKLTNRRGRTKYKRR